MRRSHDVILQSCAVTPRSDIQDVLGVVGKSWRVGKKLDSVTVFKKVNGPLHAM